MSIVKSRHFLSGASLSHCKRTQDVETTPLPLPERVTIPMLQHMGAPCDPLVKKGDTVLVGQKIGESEQGFSVPVHASCSGVVEEIIDYQTSAGPFCKAVVIKTDGEQAKDPSLHKPELSGKEDFIQAVRESGCIGLGGAGFPTFIKLNYREIEKVHSLVINGAECEPYITSDYRACLEDTDDIVRGIRAVRKYLGIQKVYIGIEDNKPKAQQLLDKAFRPEENVTVVRLKTLYPQGAEKSIIYATTGIVVDAGALPADCGVIVMNISTVGFLGRYLEDGMPLVTRRITVDGDCVANPRNLRVPIGVSIQDVLEYCGVQEGDYEKVLMGGPMMGLAMDSVQSPIVKNNNAITLLSPRAAKLPETTACIRCGKCVRICPVDLMPAKLEKAYDKRDMDTLRALHVDLCINCGCCSYICPARRHLAQKNQLAKVLLKHAKKEEAAK